jgi:hypothetical protein
MKKAISLLLAAALIVCCFSLAGCSSDKYTSSYNAVGFVHSNTDTSADMSFSEFQGVKVFKVNFRDGYSKSLIYKLKLEAGDVTVYYDANGTKETLASVSPGKSVNSKLKDLSCDSMYIIVESKEKSLNGSFSFEVKVI